MAEDTELEGEVLLAFVTGTAAWFEELRAPDAPPVRRIIDIGSGPGVGTCELARRFPDTHVTAVDGSPAMLERAARRAKAHGVEARISTRLAELPHGLAGVEQADLIWASMALHHIGDEVGVLRVLRDLLAPDGLIAIAEFGDPMHVLPDDLDAARPGLESRLDGAQIAWFAAMRAGLEDSVASADLATMLGAAGLDIVGERLVRERIDAPLSDSARRFALSHLRRVRGQVHERLDDEDLAALDVLIDPDDPRGMMHRPDARIVASRRIVIARPAVGAR
ncbi:MAG: hypothetical protein JWM12_2028 [Ilumatobacteraceae bacterium]|nr:hypothetical protein [Ilumatobacteraceae bacterium]